MELMMKYKKIPKFKDHERFLSKIRINQNTGCWEWTASKKSEYGRFHITDRDYPAHRVSWSIFKGKLNNKLVLDHICRNKKCVNPEHLREVTVNQNILHNSDSNAAKNIRKTHCKRGHGLDREDIIRGKLPSGNFSRNCRICSNYMRKIRRSNGSKN